MPINNRDPQTGRVIKVQSIEERFWSHVRICEHGRSCTICCWPWTAKIDDGGYGHFWISPTEEIGAHRMSFKIANGTLNPDLLVCHNCPTGDLRSCCQPAHLWQGTDAQNSADMVQKNRSLIGDKNPAHIHKDLVRAGIIHWVQEHPEQHAHGIRSANAKLTDDLAREIFALKGRIASRPCAKQFGVSKPVILGIWNKTLWKHIHTQ